MALTGEPPPSADSASHARGHDGAWAHEPEKGPPENPAGAAFRQIPLYLAELKTYLRFYLGAKLDGYKAAARRVAIYAALGVLGLMVAGSVVATSVLLILWGLARGLGRLLWGQYWAGEIIVGVLVLGGIALTLRIAMRRLTRSARLRTEQKYDKQRIQQRVKLGHDVHERASHH